jgi:hypothetical protein
MTSVNNLSDESSVGATGKINVKRSDGLKHDLVSVFSRIMPGNQHKVKKDVGRVIHVKETTDIEHDHGNIKLHRSDGLNCDIIRVFKSMSDANGESLQRTSNQSTETLISRLSMTKIEIPSKFLGSGKGVSSPAYARNDISNAPTSARIVHMSNTHNHLDRNTTRRFFPDGDILIHSGGFTVDGTEEEYIVFDRWLASIKDMYHYRIVVAGLSDVKQCGNDWDFIRAKLPNATHVLCHSEAKVLGIRFYGSPWHWAHEPNYNTKLGAPSSTSGRFDEIPEGVQVLITHGPSYGRLDSCSGAWSNGAKRADERTDFGPNGGQGQSHCGSKELEDAIQHVKPGLHLHGLWAECRGVLLPAGYSPLSVNSSMTDPSGTVLCSCPHVIRCELIENCDTGTNTNNWRFSLDSL